MTSETLSPGHGCILRLDLSISIHNAFTSHWHKTNIARILGIQYSCSSLDGFRSRMENRRNWSYDRERFVVIGGSSGGEVMVLILPVHYQYLDLVRHFEAGSSF